MEWKQFHNLADNSTEWRLILDTITMDEKTVGLTIQALMGMPKPTDLYWALVGAVAELGDLKRREDEERRRQADMAAAEKMRNRSRWEDLKFSTDADGFESAQRGASAEAILEAMRRMQEEIMRSTSYAGQSHAGDAFGFSFRTNRQQSAKDYFGFRAPPPPPPPNKSSQRDWWVVIGCSQRDNRAAITAAYRKRAMAIHQGGEGEEKMKELNVAKDLAFKLVLV